MYIQHNYYLQLLFSWEYSKFLPADSASHHASIGFYSPVDLRMIKQKGYHAYNDDLAIKITEILSRLQYMLLHKYLYTYLDKLDNIFHWELICLGKIQLYIFFHHNVLSHPKKKNTQRDNFMVVTAKLIHVTIIVELLYFN